MGYLQVSVVAVTRPSVLNDSNSNQVYRAFRQGSGNGIRAFVRIPELNLNPKTLKNTGFRIYYWSLCDTI